MRDSEKDCLAHGGQTPLQVHESLSRLGQRLILLGETETDKMLRGRVPIKHGNRYGGYLVVTGQPGGEYRIGLGADRSVVGKLEVGP